MILNRRAAAAVVALIAGNSFLLITAATAAADPPAAAQRAAGGAASTDSLPLIGGSVLAVLLAGIALAVLGRRARSPRALSLAIAEQVTVGDDTIQVQIATVSPGSAPVEWTPMPYDVPQDGVAYVCLGTGDKGCLFVDLGRAPGPVSVGGDPEAAARLVESIAVQLSAALVPDRASVTVVGDLGKSMGLGQVSRATTLGQVVSRGAMTPQGAAPPLELVICSCDTARDDTALAWLRHDRERRVIPIVIGGWPNAPWSLTARTAHRHDGPTARDHDAVVIAA